MVHLIEVGRGKNSFPEITRAGTSYICAPKVNSKVALEGIGNDGDIRLMLIHRRYIFPKSKPSTCYLSQKRPNSLMTCKTETVKEKARSVFIKKVSCLSARILERPLAMIPRPATAD